MAHILLIEDNSDIHEILKELFLMPYVLIVIHLEQQDYHYHDTYTK